jgi:hypothetical protein
MSIELGGSKSQKEISDSAGIRKSRKKIDLHLSTESLGPKGIIEELPFSLAVHEQNIFPPVIEKRITQNTQVDVVIDPSDENIYCIHTNGRIGCDASLLWTTEPNGIEHVTITHFDPEHIEDHLQVIQKRGNSHPEGKRHGVLLTRGDEIDPWRQKVTEALQNYVGGDIDVIAMPHLGLDEAKELADPLNKLKYQLSFVRGYGGDMDDHKVQVEGSNYKKKHLFRRSE